MGVLLGIHPTWDSRMTGTAAHLSNDRTELFRICEWLILLFQTG
jgi:hypothetical protein